MTDDSPNPEPSPARPQRTYVTSPPLFGIATSAYHRTQSSLDDRSPEQADAIVAVIFSVVSLETFINEIRTLASMTPVPISPSEPA